MKNRVIIWSSSSTFGYIVKGNKISIFNRCHVGCSVIYNSQDMETAQGSINGWLNKENVIKHDSGRKKKEILPFTIMKQQCAKSNRKRNTAWYHLYVETEIWIWGTICGAWLLGGKFIILGLPAYTPGTVGPPLRILALGLWWFMQFSLIS